MLTVGSLFSGIGGLELGLERTGGFKTVWQVEKDEFARRVLAKHWPDVRRWDDVCTFPPAGEWGCDLICGGFPCQDISSNGNRTERNGLGGERSGLWSEFSRVIRLLRPRFVIVENVSAILARGLGDVLRDLAEGGYDAEWDCLPATVFGAPHHRERLFLIAYPNNWRCGRGSQRHVFKKTGFTAPQRNNVDGLDLAYAWPWLRPPGVYRVDGRLPNRAHRTRCLGNAVVPQVAEWIGRRILESLQ